MNFCGLYWLSDIPKFEFSAANNKREDPGSPIISGCQLRVSGIALRANFAESQGMIIFTHKIQQE
jgi:hypothetical protein